MWLQAPLLCYAHGLIKRGLCNTYEVARHLASDEVYQLVIEMQPVYSLVTYCLLLIAPFQINASSVTFILLDYNSSSIIVKLLLRTGLFEYGELKSVNFWIFLYPTVIELSSRIRFSNLTWISRKLKGTLRSCVIF